MNERMFMTKYRFDRFRLRRAAVAATPSAPKTGACFPRRGVGDPPCARRSIGDRPTASITPRPLNFLYFFPSPYTSMAAALS
eukprot:1931234-Prymnesium_polylepis.1